MFLFAEVPPKVTPALELNEEFPKNIFPLLDATPEIVNYVHALSRDLYRFMKNLGTITQSTIKLLIVQRANITQRASLQCKILQTCAQCCWFGISGSKCTGAEQAATSCDRRLAKQTTRCRFWSERVRVG